MNRNQLQALSKLRLAESVDLLRLAKYSGAYYLAGYAVECALKSAIAKQTSRYDFPDLRRAQGSHTHNLKELARIAELNAILLEASRNDSAFSINWEIALRWSQHSRYMLFDKGEAETLVDALRQKRHGVMVWLTQHW